MLMRMPMAQARSKDTSEGGFVPYLPLQHATPQRDLLSESTARHEFGRLQVRNTAAPLIQTKREGGRQDDEYEKDADPLVDQSTQQPMESPRGHDFGRISVREKSPAAPVIQRDPDPSAPDDKALQDEAAALEKEVMSHPTYKGLKDGSKARVWWIIALAKKKPLGKSKGQRNYYLAMLKVALTTPFNGKDDGKTEYGCSDQAEKDNREAVEKALGMEKMIADTFGDLDEQMVATGTNKVRRMGQGGKGFYVDRSDPKNIRVQMKVKLKGKKEEVESIKALESAIEAQSHTKGYWLDIVFVDKSGPDVFEFTTKFCEWANSGNWASSPTALSHEAHHALGLPDRYDYIEAHSRNPDMNVAMRLVWFVEQMHKTAGARDPYSKMDTESNPLLSEDVCAVAFGDGPERKKCIEARKDLDPAGIPAHEG